MKREEKSRRAERRNWQGKEREGEKGWRLDGGGKQGGSEGGVFCNGKRLASSTGSAFVTYRLQVVCGGVSGCPAQMALFKTQSVSD